MTFFLIFIFTILHAAYFAVNYKLKIGLKSLFNSKKGNSKEKPPVSVLISIRNEEDVLEKCLDSMISQEYPKLKTQLILIDDRSSDNTAKILKDYKSKHPKLIRIISVSSEIPSGISPKKNALIMGLKAARGDIIFSTDADCIAKSTWISQMVTHFQSDTSMVLGLTTYYHDSKLSKWLSGIQSLEFLSHSVVSASLVGNGFPVNANANNMAYSKKAFDDIGGYKSNQNIVSGDDDFLMQKIDENKTGKIKFSIDPSTHVTTRPSQSIGEIWEQRKRWASKCGFYGGKQVVFLSFIYGYYTLIMLSIIFGFFNYSLLTIGIISFLIKTFLDFQVLNQGAILFQKQKLMKWFIPTSLIHIPLIVLAVIFGSFGYFKWKGQLVSKKAK